MKKIPSGSLKGFTIMEIIIALVVSSIVIMSILSVITLVSHSFSNYRSSVDELNSVALFARNIQNDCFYAESIKKTGENEICINRCDYPVVYGFSNKHIVRQDVARIDTFQLEVFDFNIISEEAGFNQIEALNITISLKKDTIPFLFTVKEANRKMINENVRKMTSLYISPVPACSKSFRNLFGKLYPLSSFLLQSNEKPTITNNL
jgi:competence protein ComGF